MVASSFLGSLRRTQVRLEGGEVLFVQHDVQRAPPARASVSTHRPARWPRGGRRLLRRAFATSGIDVNAADRARRVSVAVAAKTGERATSRTVRRRGGGAPNYSVWQAPEETGVEAPAWSITGWASVSVRA